MYCVNKASIMMLPCWCFQEMFVETSAITPCFLSNDFIDGLFKPGLFKCQVLVDLIVIIKLNSVKIDNMRYL